MLQTTQIQIEIDGEEIDDFIEFSIDQPMNKLHQFIVRCRMDTFEDIDDFVLSQSKKYIGSTITIHTESADMEGNKNQELFFKGIVHSVKAFKSTYESDSIVIVGYSPDSLLLSTPNCKTFFEKSLRQIVEEVLRPYPRDIIKSNIDPTYTETILYCVQYKESNLAFLQRLAKRYGEWFYYNGKELYFGKANGNTQELIHGIDLNAFEYSLQMHATGTEFISYNYLNGETIKTKSEKTSGKNQQNEPGKYTFDQSNKHFNTQSVNAFNHINVASNNSSKEQKRIMELNASSIVANISEAKGCSENMNLVPGSIIKVKATKMEGSGEVDYGDYRITSVKHSCNNIENYKNTFTAIPAESQVPKYTNPDAYPTCETQSAIVIDNKDPEKLGRIQVRFFWQTSNDNSPWIRIVSPYSGAERGFYFVPEIDDEVLVGFEANDAERPYIIGSLYHGKHKPTGKFPNNNNSFKGIVTQSNLMIELDDENKQTSISTPGGNIVQLSDNGGIQMTDSSGNSVELSSSGITLNSGGEINITAGSDITISAGANANVESGANFKVTSGSAAEIQGGVDVKLSAGASFKAEGAGTAEVSSSGITVIKGSLVNIN